MRRKILDKLESLTFKARRSQKKASLTMTIRYLGDFDGRRDNNFTLVRILFALMVLFGHSYHISGNGYDPISKLIVPYPWLGDVAVGGFFAISGFLVTASFASRSATQYVLSRSVRIYPAIVVYCIVAILIVGPLGSSVGPAQYFATQPFNYLKNALLWSWHVNLPYNFLSNPFPGSTNGSMWTLPIEMRSYGLVLTLGLLGIWRNRLAATITLIGLLYFVLFGSDVSYLFAGENRYHNPMAFFAVGCFAWVNRDIIPLSWPIVIAAFFVQLLFLTGPYRIAVHSVCLAYIIFYLVYRVRHINIDKFGDISFGVYIYAWPLQQLVWWPGQSGLTNAILATILVVPTAYLSWWLVEKPALHVKSLLDFRKTAHAVQRGQSPLADRHS